MATALLIIIYIAFIGLGIPDSLFGTAWPAIYSEFELPISFGSFVTIIISCGTVLSSVISSKIISRLGTNKVSAYSTLLTALALLGFSFAPNLWVMCFWAIILGIGAGAIDVALNNYVAIHYSATHMSFLHCFYGVGVSVSPYILSLVIAGNFGWRGGYRIAFAIQLIITLLLFLSLPLWRKAHGGENESEENTHKDLSFGSVLKIPGVKMMCSLFIASCAIECTCGGWGSTFLVEYKHLPAEKAAQIIMIYYIGMTLGRFLSGVLAAKLHSWKIIKLGQIVLGLALLLLILPGGVYLCALGMFLIGLGNGPLFPNFNYLTPENFGSDISQSIIGIQMASAYIGIMIAPTVCGLLGQVFGMVIFPFYLIVFYAIMIPVTIRIKTVLKRNAK
ncbi:MAG: MFS transporter [Clostridia bacterium]|jgi:MFS family permease|nr:MFS transporter [Clostridia bacterium]